MAQLLRYDDSSYIREATAEEWKESIAAAHKDGGAGVILVDNERCFVPGDRNEDIHVTRVDKAGGVYGHATTHCDEAGCAGDELYYGPIPDVEVDNVYEILGGKAIAILDGDDEE